MKKLLIVLLTLLMLTSCGKKKVPWEEVKSNFESTKQEVSNATKDIEIILKEDYSELLYEVKNYIEIAEYDVKEENQSILVKAYKIAYHIEDFASRAKAKYAKGLLTLAKDIMAMCEINYDGEEEEFETLKSRILEEIDTFENWTDADWSNVEILKKIKWAEVETDFLALEEEAYAELLPSEEITETDLESLKTTIIDGITAIQEEDEIVTAKNLNLVKSAYKSCVLLNTYAYRVYCDDSLKVRDFTEATMGYIKECFGKKLEDEEKYEGNYEEHLDSAKKYTQSTWNQIAARLRMP